MVLNEDNLKEEINPVPPYMKLNKISYSIGAIDIVLEQKINPDYIQKYLEKTNLNYNIYTRDKNNRNISGCNYINDYTFINIFKIRAFIYVYKEEPCKFKMCFNIKSEKNIEKEINKIINKISGLKLLANYNSCNNISVKTSTFFNFMGTNCYSGGAERYLLDLHEVCEELGLNLDVYQHGEISFFRKYNNVNIIGLKNEKIENSYEFLDKQSKNYIYHTYNNTLLHIYSAFQECYPNHIGPSIGISHGISWDARNNHYSYGMNYFWEKIKIYLDAAYYCDKLISVDTNTPNWFQTIDYELGNKKFHVISNYVDNKEFCPRKNYLKKPKKIIVTFPRRLTESRGLYIVLDIIDEILSKYQNIEFHFVGKGTEEDTRRIKEKELIYPNNVKRYSKPSSEMTEVYKYTDISLIPTQYSEGTSLSCLEAMSSGNIVIATRIGGLTDLIINGYNGYLIEPSSNSLKSKLINILENFEKQKEIRKNAIDTTKKFNKNEWKEKWKKEISAFEISEKSKNNDLIEIYINDIKNISLSLLEIIKIELQKGNLVYLRTFNIPKTDNISHGLLQVVDSKEEIVSFAKRVYKEKSYNEKIERKEKIISI